MSKLQKFAGEIQKTRAASEEETQRIISFHNKNAQEEIQKLLASVPKLVAAAHYHDRSRAKVTILWGDCDTPTMFGTSYPTLKDRYFAKVPKVEWLTPTALQLYDTLQEQGWRPYLTKFHQPDSMARNLWASDIWISWDPESVRSLLGSDVAVFDDELVKIQRVYAALEPKYEAETSNLIESIPRKVADAHRSGKTYVQLCAVHSSDIDGYRVYTYKRPVDFEGCDLSPEWFNPHLRRLYYHCLENGLQVRFATDKVVPNPRCPLMFVEWNKTCVFRRKFHPKSVQSCILAKK